MEFVNVIFTVLAILGPDKTLLLTNLRILETLGLQSYGI